jgi:hypothetical protein
MTPRTLDAIFCQRQKERMTALLRSERDIDRIEDKQQRKRDHHEQQRLYGNE